MERSVHVRRLAKISLLALAAVSLTGMQGRLTNLDARLLAEHNRERELMNVPPLRWNDELAAGAREWADHLAATGRFEHSPNLPGQPLEGENLWAGTVGAYDPEAMVNLWIAEKTEFRPGVFPANSDTGNVADVSHYTQLIWRRTGEVGCALARGSREEVLVCRYSQPGNIMGRKPF